MSTTTFDTAGWAGGSGTPPRPNGDRAAYRGIAGWLREVVGDAATAAGQRRLAARARACPAPDAATCHATIARRRAELQALRHRLDTECNWR